MSFKFGFKSLCTIRLSEVSKEVVLEKKGMIEKGC